MLLRPKRRLAVALAFAGVAVVALPVAAAPGLTACTLAPALPLERGQDGWLFDRAVPAAAREQAVLQVTAARARIEARFGRPAARPVLIRLASPAALWPLILTPLASTHFAGTRACVIVGPDGANVDVVAHELMHAEIFERVGAFRRSMELPVWFDEGVAMQVDDRFAFDLPATTPIAQATAIRSATSYHAFFDVPPAKLTEHFALAKSEVGRWLQRSGRRHFYQRLADLRRGQSFDELWDRASLTAPRG